MGNIVSDFVLPLNYGGYVVKTVSKKTRLCFSSGSHYMGPKSRYQVVYIRLLTSSV